jgi:hypothetical protein
MRFRRCLCLLLGATHLATVVCGAADCLPEQNRSVPVQVLQAYAKLSGADSQYGFYAPEVGASCRAKFILQDDQGSTWSDSLEATTYAEARLRLGGSVECAFANDTAQQLPKVRQRLVKSWAATMFTRHPRAASVTVVVEVRDIPTMAEYRGGLRPNWIVVYKCQVLRGPPVASERTMP